MTQENKTQTKTQDQTTGAKVVKVAKATGIAALQISVLVVGVTCNLIIAQKVRDKFGI